MSICVHIYTFADFDLQAIDNVMAQWHNMQTISYMVHYN